MEINIESHDVIQLILQFLSENRLEKSLRSLQQETGYFEI